MDLYKPISKVQSFFITIWIHSQKSSPSLILYGSVSNIPVHLLYYTDPFHKSIPPFNPFPKIQSVFYTIRIRSKNPVRLSYYTDPFPKIQYLFYTIWIYTDPFQKSNPSLIQYGSIKQIQSVFYTIWIRFQKSSPSFILYGL